AGDVADAVVGVNCARGGDGVGVAGDVAGGGGRSADARRRVGQAQEGGRGDTVDQAGVARRQCRENRPVDLGVGIRGDGRRGRGDGEVADDIGDGVVAGNR